MIQAILLVILLIITAACVGGLFYFYNLQRKRSVKKTTFTTLLISLLASLALLITIPSSFHQVNTGTVAVVRKLGKIEGIREPGTHFDFYMINTYEIYDTKVQQDKIITSAYSKDGQTMDLEVFLQYQIQTNNVIAIATEYGSLEALQARIETVTIEKTKAVMSSAEAMTIIQNRATFSEDVSQAVRSGISSDYYVNVKDVVLTNIDFTNEFERSVEDKVIAEQEKQAAITRAEAELEVARIEAERKITEAKGNAEAKIILATAEAQAASSKIIELARSLGFEVESKYVYTKNEVIVDSDNKLISDVTSEIESPTKLDESSTIDTLEGNQIKTTTISLKETRSTIIYDADHTKDDLDKLVVQYLEYLAYLEKWDGVLPTVISGDEGLSIIIPNA